MSIYNYPRLGWWKMKAEYARTLSLEALQFARTDCIDTARNGMEENQGKYFDESSIYAQELARRNK